MNIALFSDSFYPELGGIQDSVLILARGLVQRGHEVTCFVPSFSKKDCQLVNVPFEELNTGNGIRIVRFSSIHIPSSTQQSRLVIPTGLRWKQCAGKKFDVIHTHTFLGVGLEGLSAAKHLRCPLIGTNHWAMDAFNGYFPLNLSWIRRLLMKTISWYYNHCQFVLAPSHSVLRAMEEHGLESPHEVLSNPIDTRLFSPVSEEQKRVLKKKFALSDTVMVFAGRLGPEKNIDVLIRNLALLKERIPTISLAIAGHGSHGSALRKLAHSLGVEKHVKFFGTLSQSDLADLFKASDVFTIASTSETQSMTLLQAMACGLPSVGVNSRALPEYIRDTVTGLIAECGNEIQFATSVETILRNPQLRHSFGTAARTAASNYSIEKIIERAEKIYQDVIRDYTGTAKI